MRVLAIDPGYDRVGVAILEKQNQREALLFSECLETDKNLSVHERIFFIGQSLEEIIQNFSPNALAIENLFFNKNIKTAISVAEARGAIIYLAKKTNCQIFEFGPQEIKIATTGYGKSDKAAVIAMVKRLISNAPENALDDEYDAIAVGITCLAVQR